MTMDEDLTGPTGELIAGLALFRGSSAPAPSPELTAMFAATASTTARSTRQTPRRTPMHKRTLRGIPGKIVAGALGALLAGSVGAGALTGTMAGSANDDDSPAVETPAVDDGAVVTDEHPDEVESEEPDVAEGDEAAVDEVDDDGANDAAGDADLAAVPVPTSVSEAAHTHDFDEACGNHGHYVSWFARFGEEAACATDARTEAAATGDEPQTPTDQSVTGDDSADGADVASTEVTDSHGNGGKSGTNWQSKQQHSAKGAKGNKKSGR